MLKWVAWFNNHRLLEPIGYIPPTEAEAQYCRQLANTVLPVLLESNSLHESWGDSIVIGLLSRHGVDLRIKPQRLAQ